jgi:hypothetical protein
MAKRRRHAKSKRAHSRHQYRARSHTAQHRKRRRRTSHNPFKIAGVGGIGRDLTGALIGAGGAIGTDIAMAYAAPYLPAALQSGWLNVITRAAAALGVGFLAGKVAGRDTGKAVAAGGLIVVAYSGLKQALAPTLGSSIKGLSGLADFGDYAPAYSQSSAAMVGAGMGAYMPPRLGAYMQPRLGAYMNPGSMVSASPLAARQRQMAGFGGFGGYDSESM